ncbi:MAG: 30S ribosomal protein S11 [Candidatus Portnoybacteria bacterium]|nr:30S ribosomal protein S11 [Candidatus Portnoybacteria bacterium]
MGKKRVVSRTEVRGEEKFRQFAAKKVKGKKLTQGRVYIHTSFNNTILTLTDLQGNIITWVSTGAIGFTGPKRGTPYAAIQAAKALAAKAADTGLKEVEVFIKGIGPGREAAIRSLAGEGLNVIFIKDITPIPFGGPRPPKPRRV